MTSFVHEARHAIYDLIRLAGVGAIDDRAATAYEVSFAVDVFAERVSYHDILAITVRHVMQSTVTSAYSLVALASFS